MRFEKKYLKNKKHHEDLEKRVHKILWELCNKWEYLNLPIEDDYFKWADNILDEAVGKFNLEKLAKLVTDCETIEGLRQ